MGAQVATRCNDLGEYVLCATHWLDCLLKHYTEREVRILLADVIKHVDVAFANAPVSSKSGGAVFVEFYVSSFESFRF